jgi:putative oxidoreductase
MSSNTISAPGRSSPQAAAQPVLGNAGEWHAIAAVPLRLVIGFGFLAHGFAKLSRGPETFATVLHTLGVPAPHLMAWLTTVVELAGGFAVIAGAFVPIVSVPLAVVLVTALATVHWRYGFFSVKLAEVTDGGIRFGTVGYEIILLYLAGLVALAVGGAGAWSFDRWLDRRRHAPAARDRAA